MLRGTAGTKNLAVERVPREHVIQCLHFIKGKLRPREGPSLASGWLSVGPGLPPGLLIFGTDPKLSLGPHTHPLTQHKV